MSAFSFSSEVLVGGLWEALSKGEFSLCSLVSKMSVLEKEKNVQIDKQ